MRRGFWVALGLGAGATGAVITSRWARRQANRVKPSSLAREAKGGLLDLSKLVAESIEEGRRAMEERERELRNELADARGDGREAEEPGVR
jgi:membrane protein involved in colicin uptake